MICNLNDYIHCIYSIWPSSWQLQGFFPKMSICLEWSNSPKQAKKLFRRPSAEKYFERISSRPYTKPWAWDPASKNSTQNNQADQMNGLDIGELSSVSFGFTCNTQKEQRTARHCPLKCLRPTQSIVYWWFIGQVYIYTAKFALSCKTSDIQYFQTSLFPIILQTWCV